MSQAPPPYRPRRASLYAAQRTTTMGYDVLGRETTLTDGNGHTATASYDAVGRLRTETSPVGGVVTHPMLASLSLGMGQRFAVKGGYILTPRGDGSGSVSALTELVVP